MIKQIPTQDVDEHVKNNSSCILLDVRTEEEWNIDGRPDGEKIGLKTYFLTIKFADGTFNNNFIKDFKNFNIGKETEILTMCMGGVRSQAAAEILIKENYNCSNISDGFLGNSYNLGWKRNKLPVK